ncbi:hypothetical protein GCM10010329_19040 [Streptomyces spiroverticillatus]|uniref:Uncharacterized protein n=1 Tax=Streptomyces finlayi TaxID=67296 RepID=A0A918WU25_9ACTN|nr:DUF6328 family protein [Streptomyces finlayi]GGZ97895.1 hypothetical protein GCM10010329_19040 [Streptomyces spiroverticillatus]GHC82892.1 hypothetical protein GCM10010334_11520 [Streptomyces finlayi]
MAEEQVRTPREETTLEQADRNYGELLQELRIVQAGVQILFAFLLTVAFSARLPSLDTVQRAMYVATLLLAVVAAALFTAPAALHRTLFQSGSKPEIVRTSARLAATGMVVLVLTLGGSVLLVVDVVLGRVEGVIAGSGTLMVCGGLWVLLPQFVRRHAKRRSLRRAAAEEPSAGRPEVGTVE